jgi:hypothetical protein
MGIVLRRVGVGHFETRSIPTPEEGCDQARVEAVVVLLEGLSPRGKG